MADTVIQKLRHMVTLPHFEKVREMWDSRKMCWGVGGGREDVGRGMRGSVGKCVGVWGRCRER